MTKIIEKLPPKPEGDEQGPSIKVKVHDKGELKTKIFNEGMPDERKVTSRWYQFVHDDGQITEHFVKQGTDKWLKEVGPDEEVCVARSVYNGYPFPKFFLADDIQAPKEEPAPEAPPVQYASEVKTEDLPF